MTTSSTTVTRRVAQKSIAQAIYRITGGGRPIDTTNLSIVNLSKLRAHQYRARMIMSNMSEVKCPSMADALTATVGHRLSLQEQRLCVTDDTPLTIDCKVCETPSSVCMLSSPFVYFNERTTPVCRACGTRVGHEHEAVRGFRLRRCATRDMLRTRVWLATYGYERFGICVSCQRNRLDVLDSDWHVAHDVADSLGGELNIKNTRPTCVSCNLTMKTTTIEEHMKTLCIDPPRLPPLLSTATIDVLEHHIASFAMNEKNIL